MMRKAGWYWVKYAERLVSFGATNEWAPLYWQGERFEDEHYFLEHQNIGEVGPRIPTPDEPWQCVPVDPAPDMIEAGAQALVQWACDGLVWPDSWSVLDVQSARRDAKKAYRAMVWEHIKGEP